VEKPDLREEGAGAGREEEEEQQQQHDDNGFTMFTM